MKNLCTAAGLLVLAALSACASIHAYDGASLVPGRSTAAEVQAVMGEPTEKVTVGGDTLFWYPRQAISSRESYAVRVGPDNVVKSVEQRLTEENLKQIVAGKTTMQDMRALMGPPYYKVRYVFRDGDSWEYRMGRGPIDDWMILSVRFDAQGVAQEVTYIADPVRNFCCDNSHFPP